MPQDPYAYPPDDTPPWGQPPHQQQQAPQYPSRHPEPPQRPARPAWYRRVWVIGLAALIIGIALGNLGGGGNTEPAAADAEATPATPGSCLRALDLADAGQATPGSGEYGHVAADCRSKAGAPAVAAAPPPADEPEAPATTAAAVTTTTVPPPEPVEMPDLERLNYADALTTLEELGVAAERVDYTPLGQSSIMINPFDWLVTQQEPAAGQTLEPDTTVQLGVVDRDDPEAAGITPRLG